MPVQSEACYSYRCHTLFQKTLVLSGPQRSPTPEFGEIFTEFSGSTSLYPYLLPLFPFSSFLFTPFTLLGGFLYCQNFLQGGMQPIKLPWLRLCLHESLLFYFLLYVPISERIPIYPFHYCSNAFMLIAFTSLCTLSLQTGELFPTLTLFAYFARSYSPYQHSLAYARTYASIVSSMVYLYTFVHFRNPLHIPMQFFS